MNDVIAKDNEDSLLVFTKLSEAFERCEEYAAPYLNLVALFFGDLMRSLTGYALRRNELQGPWAPPQDLTTEVLRGYPYIGYRDILRGVDLGEKEFQIGGTGVRRWLGVCKWESESYLKSLLYNGGSNRLKRIGMTPHLSHRDQVLSLLARKGIHANSWACQAIPIPNRSQQLRELRKTVCEICEVLELPDRPQTTAALMEQHILARSREEDPPDNLPYSAILTGSLMASHSLFPAALGRFSGVPVIGVAHGEFDGVVDEPAVGYTECTFADIRIGYGPEAGRLPENHGYRKSLYTAPKYITADSNFIRSRYVDEVVEPLGALESKVMIYVPAQFYGQHRYGPFHVMADQLYLAWQQKLFQEFPDMILKRHPKELRPKLFPCNAVRVVYDLLEECLDQADIFVFDIFSGAMCIAAATSKPIIYFHLGLRNFTEIGERAIRQRCIWIDVVPPGEHVDLRGRIDAQMAQPKINILSQPFCLGEENGSVRREQTIFKTVCEIVGR